MPTGFYERPSILGFRFGKLTVAEKIGKARNRAYLWRCVCDCGREINADTAHLKFGQIRSCGCQRAESLVRHGLLRKASVHPLRSVWSGMIQRCTNKKNLGYHRYGGRGISVCDRWRVGEDGMTGFHCFVTDMPPRPSLDYSIDRRDNDGNYEPDNCRWATRLEQSRNQRKRQPRAAASSKGAANESRA